MTAAWRLFWSRDGCVLPYLCLHRTLVNTVGVPGDAGSSPGKSRGGMPYIWPNSQTDHPTQVPQDITLGLLWPKFSRRYCIQKEIIKYIRASTWGKKTTPEHWFLRLFGLVAVPDAAAGRPGCVLLEKLLIFDTGIFEKEVAGVLPHLPHLTYLGYKVFTYTQWEKEVAGVLPHLPHLTYLGYKVFTYTHWEKEVAGVLPHLPHLTYLGYKVSFFTPTYLHFQFTVSASFPDPDP